MSKTYRLFISHSWAYGDAYDKLIKMLDAQGLDYYNHSVPQNDPLHTNGTQKQLREAIDAQIRGTSCVLILAGVYATYSKMKRLLLQNHMVNLSLRLNLGGQKKLARL